MSRSLGVWVAGPSRSGTSLVAGLLAQHGVFFGTCRQPTPDNRKGFFENVYLKDVIAGREHPEHWPAEWFERLVDHGWDGSAPWGAKTGPERFSLIRPMKPAVIVICRRPFEQIERSRARTTWCQGPASRAVERSYEAAGEVKGEVDVPVLEVRTDELVAGDYQWIPDVLDMLGLEFDASIAEDWIDPSMWSGP